LGKTVKLIEILLKVPVADSDGHQPFKNRLNPAPDVP
jgi:hypothetical protein